MLTKDEIGIALVKRLCPVCAKPQDAEIVMNTTISKKAADNVKKMHGQIVGQMDKPCKTCEEYMKKSIILMTYDPDKTDDPSNPYRTGGFFVVTEEYIKGLLGHDKKLLNEILTKRYSMIEHQVAEALGFFNFNTEEDEQPDTEE